MSSQDDGLYRGDPPTGHPAPPYGPPGYTPPQYAPPQYAPPQYAPPQYAPPQYAPPGYAPPPAYGPPPGWAPGWAPAPGWRPTNTMATLALVSVFVFAPAALVFGLVARSQIRRTGEGGDGMALAGIIVGGIALTVAAVVVVFWVAALASLGNGLAP